MAFINVRESIAARKFIRKLANTPKSLRQFPDLGRRVPELETEEEREVIVGAYRLIYSSTTSELFVLRILHTARDFPAAWKHP